MVLVKKYTTNIADVVGRRRSEWGRLGKSRKESFYDNETRVFRQEGRRVRSCYIGGRQGKKSFLLYCSK
jgi:hypothetical protein